MNKLCCSNAFYINNGKEVIIRHVMGKRIDRPEKPSHQPRRLFHFEIKAETGTLRWTCFEDDPLAKYLGPRLPTRKLYIVKLKSVEFADGKCFELGRDFQAFIPFVEGELSNEELCRREKWVEIKHRDEGVDPASIIHKDIQNMDRKLKAIVPHAKRGLKVLDAAAQGGREASKYQEPKRNEIKQALKEYIAKPEHNNLSLTSCRKNIAMRFNVSRRSVERYTKGIKRK